MLGVPRRSCGPDYGHVQLALAACFADKAAWHSGGGVYVWLADKAQQFEKKARVLVVCYKVVVSGSSKKRQMQQQLSVTQVDKHMLPESVRADVPERKAYSPGPDVMKAWRESEIASTSEESAPRETPSANDDAMKGWQPRFASVYSFNCCGNGFIAYVFCCVYFVLFVRCGQ